MLQPLYLDLLLAAFGRFHKRQADRHIDVVAPDRSVRIAGARAAAKASETAAKKALEDISDVKTAKAPIGAASAGAVGRIHARVAELIVSGTLARIVEHLVRFIDLFKFCLGGFIPRIHVGVVLLCKLAICFFQVVCGCILGYPQHFIVIPFVSQLPHPCFTSR